MTRVIYPKLSSHPTYELSKKYIKLNPDCILFHISKDFIDLKNAQKILSLNKYLPYETSYVSSYSRLLAKIWYVRSSRS